MRKKKLQVCLSILLAIGLFAQSAFMGNVLVPVEAASNAGVQWEQAWFPLIGGATNSGFGNTLAMTADGSLIVVGASTADVTTKDGYLTGAGKVLIYHKNVTYNSWESSQLIPDDLAAGDRFGVSAAISDDGSIVVIGAYQANIDGKNNQGAAYVFSGVNHVYTQQAKLTAASGSATDLFGCSVAVSSSGLTALIGANNYSKTYGGQGAAYVFTRSGSTWTQQTINPLVATDAAASDVLGGSVALSGNGTIALIGAPNKDSNQGAAYVFALSGTTWTQRNKIEAWDGHSGDDFAASLSLNTVGDVALIGADDATVNGHSTQGAAYTFTRSGSTWSNGEKLIAAGGKAGDWLGYSVSLSGDGSTAVVGEPNAQVLDQAHEGAAVVFYGTDFSQQKKLVASNGLANARVGTKVSVDDDGSRIVVGSLNFSWDTPNLGCVYIYVRFNPRWWQIDEMVNTNGSIPNYWGTSLALSGDGKTAIVGSMNMNKVDIYTRIYDKWVLQASIPSNDSISNDFGSSVALSGDGNTALVGAWSAIIGNHQRQGAAYILTRTGKTWTVSPRFYVADGDEDDAYGASVALSADGNTAVIGASGYDYSAGAVYVLQRSGSTWSALPRIERSTTHIYEYFGSSVAVSGDGSTILAGAPHAFINTLDRGDVSCGAADIYFRSAGSYSLQKEYTSYSCNDKDRFGKSVALSSDGNKAVIGSPYEDSGQIWGSAYISTRTSGIWAEFQNAIYAPDWQFGDEFSTSVAISADGNTIAVGAKSILANNVHNQGAVYVFSDPDSSVGKYSVFRAKLFALDGSENVQDAAKIAMSASGHDILMGAENMDDTLGGVYFFSDQPNIPIFVPRVTK